MAIFQMVLVIEEAAKLQCGFICSVVQNICLGVKVRHAMPNPSQHQFSGAECKEEDAGWEGYGSVESTSLSR